MTYSLAFALGIATRFGLHSHPESKGLYIVEYLFVVLSVRFHFFLQTFKSADYFSHALSSLRRTYFLVV
jgi:hypothetical protein